MAATYDTLSYAGIERTLSGWGFALDGLQSERFNQREDYFRGKIPVAGVLGDPIFAFESQVIIRTGRSSANGADNTFTGGTIKFQGKAMTPIAQADGDKQFITQEFRGPWYDLSNSPYLQSFQGIAANPYSIGEIILNTGINQQAGLVMISMGDQIQSILQFHLDQYKAQGMAAPFQYVGRTLNAGAIDLSTDGTIVAPASRLSTKAGGRYVYQLPANLASCTIDPALYDQFLVSYIMKPCMASQALQKMLELSPRTNIAFDYSTQPPTIYVRSIDNFAAVSLPLSAGTDFKTMNLKRRDDLVARAINLYYKITNSVNGQQVVDYVQDKFGPNGAGNAADPIAGLRVLVDVIDLAGFSSTSTTAQLDCEPIRLLGGNNASKRKWWSDRRGGEQGKFLDSRTRFQDFTNNEVQIPNGVLTYATTGGTDLVGNPRVAGQPLSLVDQGLFTNRIVNGTYHDWMATGGIYALKVRAAVTVQHASYDAVATGDTVDQLPVTESLSNSATNGNRLGRVNAQPVYVNLQLTNATNPPGGHFTAGIQSSFTPGEIYITGNNGIAAYVFNSLQKFQYEGEYAEVAGDFENNVQMINCVNFSGGRAEWATMNAQPQSILEDWGDKKTMVKIGVANHLTAGQLSSLLNMWTSRRAWYNPALRASNSAGSSNNVVMPTTAGGANTTEGVKAQEALWLFKYLTQPTGNAPGTIDTGIVMDPVKLGYINAMNTQ